MLSEFVEPDGDAVVWIVDGEGSVREMTMRELLPDNFGPQYLA